MCYDCLLVLYFFGSYLYVIIFVAYTSCKDMMMFFQVLIWLLESSYSMCLFVRPNFRYAFFGSCSQFLPALLRQKETQNQNPSKHQVYPYRKTMKRDINPYINQTLTYAALDNSSGSDKSGVTRLGSRRVALSSLLLSP